MYCWLECNAATVETSMKISYRTKNSFQQFYSWVYIKKQKTQIHKDTHIPVSIATLFTVAKTWKQTEAPSTNEWIPPRAVSHGMQTCKDRERCSIQHITTLSTLHYVGCDTQLWGRGRIFGCSLTQKSCFEPQADAPSVLRPTISGCIWARSNGQDHIYLLMVLIPIVQPSSFLSQGGSFSFKHLKL